ncbi:Tartrate-resistant acid phosphatase type 5 [Clydaea vesicula]|uniref:Tartrate-resistant acid phosphatase type 5 n=1 Tax=Clydaea vesicula TaxID=447962 RepID=A0AAD5U4J3_9FUNG|nr:Tartrate-resistant acid phosphatase type 5 [Clydaea vesicula]KAJ3385356.1 Tartrate-resistant acid phosphatase type 5 [Lobulomyces angularis]
MIASKLTSLLIILQLLSIFKTLPLNTTLFQETTISSFQTFEFLAIGDWGSGSADQKMVASAMKFFSDRNNNSNPQFVVGLGDNFYESGVTDVDDSKFKTVWTDVYNGSLMQLPWYLVNGNHDWRGNTDAQIKYTSISNNWNLPDYFYDLEVYVGNGLTAAFIFIETNLIFGGIKYEGEPSMRKLGWGEADYAQTQLNWIEDRLRKHYTKDYIILVGHHPVNICLNGMGNATTINKLVDLQRKYRISAYINGHTHNLAYSVIQNIAYVITGSGGKADPEKLRCMEGDFSKGGFGFVRGLIDQTGLHFEYRNENNTLLYTSAPVKKRAHLVPLHLLDKIYHIIDDFNSKKNINFFGSNRHREFIYLFVLGTTLILSPFLFFVGVFSIRFVVKKCFKKML